MGFLVIINNQNLNSGVFTDGDLKRLMQNKKNINNKKIKSFMTKNPYRVEENTLATEVLSKMNRKKITNICGKFCSYGLWKWCNFWLPSS